MTLARRSFITGLISLVAAPAIIRAGSLMPVKVMLGEPQHLTGTAIRLMQQEYDHVSGLMAAQRLQCLINFRRSIALQIINSRGLQPYSG